MIVFWVAAGVLSAAVAGLVLSRAARAASQLESFGDAADPTPILYRRQLAEIDDLAERGLMGEAERKSAHAEAGRRLLAATDAPLQAWTADPKARRWTLIVVVAAPALALIVYLSLGSPGMADQPFAARLKSWQAANPTELQPQELAAVLKKLIAERAPDPEGYRLLAIAENASQNAPETIRALRHALKLAPERADLWEMLGEAQVTEADGKLSDDAKAAFAEAAKRDPKSVLARFYLARARIDAGDKAGGIADWRALMAELPADDPRRPAIAQQIAEHEGRAEPAPAPGGGQMDMIRGMVEGLAQRLKANPDNPEGWVKLVHAYAVLGEAGKRDAALKDARARYAGRPDVVRDLDAAAKAEPMR
jgi:cytochrome c-type biogenesis protein CcmH